MKTIKKLTMMAGGCGGGAGVRVDGARGETPAAAAAKADIQKTFGFVPQFFTQASPRRRCRARGKR